jgi:SAM-dependent methyltransferase
MYRKLENLLAAYDSSDARGLSISRSLPLAHVLGFTKASITEINFPEYDLARLPFDSNTFDFCVSDFVLEHLADPHSAVAESFRVVKPGGHVIITTAFMCELHYDPIDLWRFSPMALRLMCERYSDELQIGFWGNREAWSFIDAGYRFRKIPENPNNPLFQLAMRNEETYALTTWVVAKVK